MDRRQNTNTWSYIDESGTQTFANEPNFVPEQPTPGSSSTTSYWQLPAPIPIIYGQQLRHTNPCQCPECRGWSNQVQIQHNADQVINARPMLQAVRRLSHEPPTASGPTYQFGGNNGSLYQSASPPWTYVPTAPPPMPQVVQSPLPMPRVSRSLSSVSPRTIRPSIIQEARLLHTPQQVQPTQYVETEYKADSASPPVVVSTGDSGTDTDNTSTQTQNDDWLSVVLKMKHDIQKEMKSQFRILTNTITSGHETTYQEIQGLKAKVETMTTCQICVDKTIQVCLVPCGHMMCQVCSTTVRSCPYCSKKIDRIQRVFFP